MYHHKLFREDNMINKLMELFKLHWEEEKEGSIYYYIAHEDGECLDADEYESVNIPPVELTLADSREKFLCDGILFFGDGCIEFHDKEKEDAIHWEYFDEKSIVTIENSLENLWHNQNNVLPLPSDLTTSDMEEKTFDIEVVGNVHIDGQTLQVTTTLPIKATSVESAREKAYILAKNAYLTWNF